MLSAVNATDEGLGIRAEHGIAGIVAA